MSILQVKTIEAPPFSEKEALRYAGCRQADPDTKELLSACWEEIKDRLSYKVCWRELPVKITGDGCDLGLFTLQSGHLARNLQGCQKAILFAATIGIAPDRLVAKYSRLSPAKALLFQAIGAERIEALCDVFCKGLRPRFSPGFGDLTLRVQKDIFAVLDCEKQLGLCLNESLLMTPTKSVTAFAGYKGEV